MGVRVPGRGEQCGGRRGFHQLTRVHHHDPVGALGDDAEVVGNQQERHVAFGPETVEQFQDLSLHRHVEGRGWFVGHQEVGLAGEGDGDHDPLAESAGELVRVGPIPGNRIGDADLVEQRDSAGFGLDGGHFPVGGDGFFDLIANREDRIQTGHGILKHEADPPAPNRPEGLTLEAHDVDPVEQD